MFPNYQTSKLIVSLISLEDVEGIINNPENVVLQPVGKTVDAKLCASMKLTPLLEEEKSIFVSSDALFQDEKRKRRKINGKDDDDDDDDDYY